MIKTKKATIELTVKQIVVIIIAIVVLSSFFFFHRKTTRESFEKFEQIAANYFATPPNAIIGNPMNQSTFYTSQEITFDASHSYDLNNEIKKYFWDLEGDGMISSKEKTLKHRYYEPGTYLVRLKVMNSQGAVGEAKVEIKIISINRKNTVKYNNNPLFLISNENTNSILRLIPIVIWQDKEAVKNYPFIVYHNENTDNGLLLKIMAENNANKANSFYKPYTGNSSHIIEPENLEEDYFSYWTAYSSVVLIDSTNNKKLIAALYAGFINSPLIFTDQTNFNSYESRIQNKKLYIIDKLDDTTEQNLASYMQKRYNNSQLYNPSINNFVGVNSTVLLVE